MLIKKSLKFYYLKIFLFFLLVIFIFNFSILFSKELNSKQNELLFNVQTYMDANKYDTAINIILTFLEDKNYEHHKIYLALGNAYYIQNNFEKAENAYIKGLSLSHNNELLRNNLGRLYFENQQYYNSAEQFRHIISKQKIPDKNLLLLIAYSYNNENNYIAALETFKKGIFYFPENLDFRFGIIQTLFYLDRIKEALPICKDTLRIHPDNHELRLLLAKLYISNYEYIKAIETLKVLYYTNKGTKEIYLTLADLYSYYGMYDETIYFYTKILSEDDISYRDYFRLANAYFMTFKNEKSLKFVNKGIAVEKNSDIILLKLKILYELEKYNEAIETINLEKQYLNNTGELFYLKGLIYLKLGDYKNAKKYFRSAKIFDDYRKQSTARLKELNLKK